MLTVLGWDIGGANVKAARLGIKGGQVVARAALSRPLALWRHPDRLQGLLQEMSAELGGAGWHAVTMTAELADVFATRRAGVNFVTGAAAAALPGQVRIWTVDRRLVTPDQLLAGDPLAAAAANWLALAERAARAGLSGLLADMGSTTTDLVPVADGQVCTSSRTDEDRLAAGELVYTGVLRTPVPCIVAEVPLAGQRVRCAAELFAIMADVYLVLGRIAPQDYTCDTPDGRPADPGAAAARLARLACSDSDRVSPAQTLAIARWAAESQMGRLVAAALQVLSRLGRWDLPVLGAGLGRFAVRELARRLGLEYRDLDQVLEDGGQAAPAAAAAWLLAREVGA